MAHAAGISDTWMNRRRSSQEFSELSFGMIIHHVMTGNPCVTVGVVYHRTLRHARRAARSSLRKPIDYFASPCFECFSGPRSLRCTPFTRTQPLLLTEYKCTCILQGTYICH